MHPMRAGRWLAPAGGAVVVLSMLTTVAFDVRLRDLGRGDLAQLDLTAAPFILAVAVTTAVGLALSLRTNHPVGPLFVALGVAMSLSGVLDGYDRLSLLAHDLPGSRWLLLLDEASFIPWLLLIGAVLLVTPDGRLPGPHWRTGARVVLVAAAMLFVTRSIIPGTFDRPYDALRHPLEIRTGGSLEAVRVLGGIVVSLGPLVAAAGVFVRFRRAAGQERQQIRWVAYGAVLTFVALSLTAAAAGLGAQGPVVLFSGASLAALPVTTGIAVSRYRLYDLDRLISLTVTYAVVTATLIAIWAGALLAAATIISAKVDSSLPAAFATLATAAAAVPLLRRVRETVDRRFHRRRYDALATVRAWMARPPGETTRDSVEQVLQDALEDEALSVAFWLPELETYVDASGHTVTNAAPTVVLHRDGARIGTVQATSDTPLLHEVCSVALPEIEAAQLRAALQTRITELAASRERLSSLAQDERRRLERDLHDGAQQRLLAVLFSLEAAQRRSGPALQLSEAIDQTKVALSELRDLSHGLRPTALQPDGLLEALQGVIARSPITTSLTVHGPLTPLREEVETTAYYVVTEALANATKHARASAVHVDVHPGPDKLVVVVRDDGRGGADPDGHGLRGLADRAEVVGGRLSIREALPGGTEVTVELPCVS
jgi:signal transduction histidine kinase